MALKWKYVCVYQEVLWMFTDIVYVQLSVHVTDVTFIIHTVPGNLYKTILLIY